MCFQIPFVPNLLQPQSPMMHPVSGSTTASTQRRAKPKGRPPYRSYSTQKSRAFYSSSRKRRRSVSPASSVESISSLSSLSSAPASPSRDAPSPAPSDASVTIVDVVPSAKEGVSLKRAVKTQDYMQEMYRSFRRRKRPRLARTCREILEECLKLTRDINDKEYLKVLHRRLKKVTQIISHILKFPVISMCNYFLLPVNEVGGRKCFHRWRGWVGISDTRSLLVEYIWYQVPSGVGMFGGGYVIGDGYAQGAGYVQGWLCLGDGYVQARGWVPLPPPKSWDLGYSRQAGVVRILLECFLVNNRFSAGTII